MLNNEQFYYLHDDHTYSKIDVDYHGSSIWTKSGTDQIISGKNLFKELKLLSAEAIRRLKLRKSAAINRLKELDDIINKNKPHPNARATKAIHLWIIE